MKLSRPPPISKQYDCKRITAILFYEKDVRQIYELYATKMYCTVKLKTTLMKFRKHAIMPVTVINKKLKKFNDIIIPKLIKQP